MAASEGDDQRARLSVGGYSARVVAGTGTSANPAVALCALAVDALEVAGAGLALVQHDALEWIAVSDARSETLEAIEYTLGEGPCVSAFRTGTPAFAGDLAETDSLDWPAFRREAVRVGIRAAFGFPLLDGDVCFGALNLYCDAPGRLSDGQVADAEVVAAVSGRTVLDWQSVAPAGALAWQLEGSTRHRVVVHQAVGRISVQAGVSLSDAQALLRAYAFAHERGILDVAAEVASGSLRIG